MAVAFTRRLLVLLAVLGLIGLPAVVLHVFCVGNSCSDSSSATARVPFCPLPDAIKEEISAGFYAGTYPVSPDVYAVTQQPALAGISGASKQSVATAWPAEDPPPDTSVPIVFSGEGIASGARVPAGTALDAIAPSLADVIGYDRPHADKHPGVAVQGIAGGTPPRLVLEVAWKEIGAADLKADPKAWPYLRSLLRSGSGTLGGVTGSLPLDPAATLTTIGTGGPPSAHGITGTLVRNEHGDVVEAWSPHSPPNVIATLADDYDNHVSQRSEVGLVATGLTDSGLIGNGWYGAEAGTDHDPTAYADGAAATKSAVRMLDTGGFGNDDVPDIFGIVMGGSIRAMDASLRAIVQAATRVSGNSVAVVVAGTGSATTGGSAGGTQGPSSLISTVERTVPGSEPVVQSAVAGGLFLDQQTLADGNLSPQSVVQALLRIRADGQPLLADAFPSFAISFAKYC